MNKSTNTLRIFFYVVALTLVSSMTFAQKGFHSIGVGVEGALPIGDFGEGYSIGYGATGKAFYGITENGDITGTLGYMRFGIKESSEFMSGHMSMIPIMFGYRHNFGGFYAEPQLGLMNLKSKVKMDLGGFEGLFGDLSGSGSVTKFSLGLGGGLVFGDWDLGARFQIVDSMNFLGVRLGYNFSLGK